MENLDSLKRYDVARVGRRNGPVAILEFPAGVRYAGMRDRYTFWLSGTGRQSATE
jgi:hypothetical protein